MAGNNTLFDSDEIDDKEPVLLVPPRLTKSGYATLLDHKCVPRKWHLEGRYGSRTHKVASNKMGLPLLRSRDTIDLITSLLTSSPSKCTENSEEDRLHSLRQLVLTPGVELIFKVPIVSNRIPRKEKLDATVHPELAPETFPSLLFDILQKRNSKVDNKKLPETKFSFAELFAGIGGFGVALEGLGGKCVFASEIFAPSVRTYCANTKTLPKGGVSGDIWNISTKDIPYHDILVGGFPCQPFSSLGEQPGLGDAKKVTGRRNGQLHHDNDNNTNNDNTNNDNDINDTNDSGGGRGQLFTQIVRVLKGCKPQAFLLENVPGLVHTDNGNALRTIVAALEGAGYDVMTEVCSSRCLTAQSRKRLYIVGLLQTNTNAMKDVAESDRKLSSNNPFCFPFIPDLGLRARDVLNTAEELQISFAATGVPFERMSGNNAKDKKKDKEEQTVVSPLALYRLSDAQMHQLRHRSKHWKPAKLAWDDTVCDTLDSHYGVTVGKGNSQLVPCPAPNHPRRFTPRECARLMGFGDSFLLGTSTTPITYDNTNTSLDQSFNTFIKEQYHMLGNAVCPPVIAALAGAVIARCSNIGDHQSDWLESGLRLAIELALDAVAPSRRANVEQSLSDAPLPITIIGSVL